MKLLEVTDDLLVGNEQIDEEHKELFQRINDLHEAISSKRERADIEMILAFLEDYVISHFGMEERMMIKTSYPKFSIHREKHTYFIEEFIRIRNGFTSGPESETFEYAKQIGLLLRDWLIHHIQVFDKELSGYLKNK